MRGDRSRTPPHCRTHELPAVGTPVTVAFVATRRYELVGGHEGNAEAVLSGFDADSLRQVALADAGAQMQLSGTGGLLPEGTIHLGAPILVGVPDCPVAAISEGGNRGRMLAHDYTHPLRPPKTDTTTPTCR